MPGYYFTGKRPDEEYYKSLANRKTRPNGFSKYRGVCKSNDPKKPYRAGFKHKGKNYHIGVFENEIDAAEAYNKVALKVIGPYAILNELPD
jgi:hypothetical protein